MKYKLLIVLALCIHSNSVFAGESRAALKENLEALANYPVDDSTKVILLKDISMQYRNSDPGLAKEYLHSAEGIATKIHYVPGQIIVYNDLGLICTDKGEYDSAIYFILKCIQLRENIKDNAGIARSYGNLGIVYEDLNDSTKALYYLRRGLEINKKFKDTQSIGKAYINIGVLYKQYNLNNLARYWYLKALGIFQGSNDRENLAKVYNNIGVLYYNDSNYKKALFYYFKKEAIEKELGDETDLANVYMNIATAYSNLNKDSALHYFNLAINLAKKLRNPSILMEVDQNMVNYYEKHHEFEKAFNAYGQYDSLKESIFNIDKQKAIDEMQTKYETEKKEQQITILTANKRFQGLLRNFLIVALGLILIIALVMINRYSFERKVNKIIEAQKDRTDELLLNILPAETADELKKYGKTTSKNYDEVSVLFADVKGFSILSQQMDGSALVKDLDKYFGAFDLICEKFGLEKIKTIGDAYLCAGGLPDPGKCSPKDVIDAALEMQQYVESIKQERLHKNEPYFEMRVGIHTGPVVAGVVGIKKFAYDIWGDTVNTAARMEQYGETGKVNISEQTYLKIKDCFTCTFRGNIEVKNKGIFAMYFVEGVRDKV